MKTVLQNTFFLCIGVVIGGVIMLFMSQKASTTFVELLQIQYELNEETAAKDACKNGDYLQAIRHINNLIESSAQPSMQVFEEGQQFWTPMFPLRVKVLQRVKETADPNGAGAQMINGIHQGMLAFALEQYGLYDKAQRHWRAAMLRLKKKDLAQTKEFIEKSMK
nr:hypothetical protein [uncultured Desulfobulbus sp.]